jgi:hypothetical protein
LRPRCASVPVIWFIFSQLAIGQWVLNCWIQLRIEAQVEEALMSFIKTAGHRFGIASELFSFFWGHKRWWMLPMLFTLFLFGALLILAQSSAIAPFIYTLF